MKSKENKKEKKKVKKQPKQEVVDTSLSFTNVPKQGDVTVFNSSEGDSNTNVSHGDVKTSIALIKFYIHPVYHTKFNRLKFEYALANDNYRFGDDLMFCYGVTFLKELFQKKNFFKNPTEEFLQGVVRMGKRKQNSRTISKKDSQSVYVKIVSNYSDDYNALIFSYMLKYDIESIADDKYSRTYFFYDFIDLLEKNKKEFLKFQLKGN